MIDARKLEAFATFARPRFAALRGEAHPLPSADRLSLACKELQSGFIAARNAGAFANPWTIAGIGKRETRNCAVLARLWDPLIVGDIGREFLIETLSVVDPTGKRRFPIDDIRCRPYSVICESCLAGGTTNRMDIVIQSLGGTRGWTIVIEAKIEAGLRDNQLEDYSDDLEDRRKKTGRATHLILLALNPPDELNKKVAFIRWKDIALAARNVTSSEISVTSPGSLIRDFAYHIRHFDI